MPQLIELMSRIPVPQLKIGQRVLFWAAAPKGPCPVECREYLSIRTFIRTPRLQIRPRPRPRLWLRPRPRPRLCLRPRLRPKLWLSPRLRPRLGSYSGLGSG